MSTAPYSPQHETYWAAEPPDKIAGAIRYRFERYQERIRQDGRVEIWRTADQCFHGRNPDGGYANSIAIVFGGEQGEHALVHVGHYRDLVRRMHTIATSQRPAIEATATSNDPEATSSTVIARQLLEYDLDEEGLEEALLDTHMRALVYSEGYVVQTWDEHTGPDAGTLPVAPEVIDGAAPGIPEGAEAAQTQGVEMPVRAGAVAVVVRSPLEVARDLDLDHVGEQPWYIVRTRAHRWELAARFPESSEKRKAILDAAPADSDNFTLWDARSRGAQSGESDYVHLFTLYHMPTDAMPGGRLVEVVGDEWLFDGPYPYDHCVVHRDVPSAELDRTVGYGDTWDMLALSQALDATESGIITVADAGSTVNFTAPRGQKVDSRQLAGGMQLVEYDDDGRGAPPPGLMERPEISDGQFKLAEHQRKSLETLSGINATARGMAESEVKSGADRALIATMAVQANSAQQRAYANLSRSVLNGRVRLYREKMTGERIIEIAGRDKSGHVAIVKADDLRNVRRVRVELGPPDLRTIEGKAALADKMLEAYGPAVVTPERYQALRATGRMDDFDDPVADNRTLARKENDAFREGKGGEVIAMVYHHHAAHIREHVRDLLNVELIGDAQRTNEIAMRLSHVMQHQLLWTGAPPEILAATGQDPAPSTLMGPGGPPGGPGGGPPMDAGAPPGAPPGGPGATPPMPAEGGPNMPTMPTMPTNPLDGGPGVPGMSQTMGGVQ